MPSQFAFFFVRLGDSSCEELNQFMRSHKIVRVSDNFVTDGANSGYHFLVEYYNESSDGGKQKRIDYRSMLQSENERNLFDRLKEFRKAICEKNKITGAYIVAKDEHLYEMAKNPNVTKEEIENFPHTGNIRLKEYSQLFVQKLKELNPENPVEKEIELF